ncbi:disease resistance protein RPV1-like [Telopea speciosissima]|uniref:disease resistance protein RPV1-like n=1 Tax=Telopea speciosissima TaxID=54955 RepID=UPI001CC34A8C|nr:disease resistance protein RPV1-like [Telopea speciosissima]
MVELVVQRVLRELDSTPLDECKHPIGIDSHVDKLLPLLHVGSEDVRFEAICGMGGLGKTTIAKAVYNRIFRSFNGSCFLTDVREEASQGNKGLVSLQKRLLQDIFKRNYGISSVSRGSKLISERLHRENILLILDDVDDHDQLDALAGGIFWFGQGSRVIITTRDDHNLNVHKVKKGIQIYKPEELNFGNSLQLFSLHAFSNNEPPENYKQFSHEVVRYAGGLPLTLEVLGSFLIDKNEEEWEDTLERLKDILDDKVFGKSIKSYDDKVFGKLMISYNKLGDPEKTIFLDVACHFIGWEVEEAISLWEACELQPRLAIKELIQKHLLKIDAYGKLRMHDQLQYMGRRIVLKDSYGDPAKRCRLCSQDEILKVLKKNMGTQMVEGILIDSNFEFEANDVLSCEDFEKMSNLRFLQIYGIDNLGGDFLHLPSTLRWFRWNYCPLKILPAKFYHEEVVHLDLSNSYIKVAWNDAPQNKNKRFQKLKVLILCYSEHLSSPPNFSWFPCLQRLDLRGCRSLLKVPDSICQIVSLKILLLSDCYSITKLPTSIGELKHLAMLCLSGTRLEELPDGVGQLEKLEELDVSGCRTLVKLPTSMGRMRSLHHFYLENTMVGKLPDDFSKLSSLEVLRIGMPEPARYQWEEDDQKHYLRLQLLSISMSGFPQLQELHLVGFMSLSLPDLPSTLTRLQVKYCSPLQKIPDLSNLDRLKELSIEKCKDLIYLPELPLNLTHLTVHSCSSLACLSDLSNLERLKELSIDECIGLKYLPELPLNLTHLTIRSCPSLARLSDLSNLKILRDLDIGNCKNLEEIQGLEGTKSLEQLKAWGCYKITETTRKIHGQGRLLHNVKGMEEDQSIFKTSTKGTVLCKRTSVDDKFCNGSPILCVVFAFRQLASGTRLDRSEIQAGDLVSITLRIDAFIRWREKRTWCCHSIRIEDMELTYRDDIIYIHHFEGFDWFGFPLESKYAIEELSVEIERFGDLEPEHSDIRWTCEVEFCKLLFENEKSRQQMSNQQSSAMMVEDFFRWSQYDNDERVVFQAGNDEEYELSEAYSPERVLRARAKACLDKDDEAAGSGKCNCFGAVKAVWRRKRECYMPRSSKYSFNSHPSFLT